MDGIPQQGQTGTYNDSGYNSFFERSPRTYCANDAINSLSSVFIEDIVDNAIIYDPFTDSSSQNLNAVSQPITADQIQGGTFTSTNGDLTIDMDSGEMNFSNGISNLLNVGGLTPNGDPAGLTINNALNQELLSSDQAPASTDTTTQQG